MTYSWGNSVRKDNRCSATSINTWEPNGEGFAPSVLGIAYNDGRFASKRILPHWTTRSDRLRERPCGNPINKIDISNVASLNCIRGKIELEFDARMGNKDAIYILVDPINFASRSFGDNNSTLHIDFNAPGFYPPDFRFK